jgi:sulfate adenylyltransferase subunit 1
MIRPQKPPWKKEKQRAIFNMNALTFITCGSVDDGKSTLIGRLLMDSKAILADQLASASRKNSLLANTGSPDLAAFTDGLQAEREQGITIDVAWRYFSTPVRKYIIGDTPGHEQYTRNMVTAATNADAAVVIVDATKLDWPRQGLSLLTQTRRHALLLKLLRVDNVVFAVNKLDALADAALAFKHISEAITQFTRLADIGTPPIVPISALEGYNVVTRKPSWASYDGPSLLDILEALPVRGQSDTKPTLEGHDHRTTNGSRPSNVPTMPLHFSVQWVEQHGAAHSQAIGRRIYWGQLVAGDLGVGDLLSVYPSGQQATVAKVLSDVRSDVSHQRVQSGPSLGVLLDRELDISRGDWLVHTQSCQGHQEVFANVAWLDNTPLRVGNVYWALHGHRWTKARITAIDHQVDIQTLDTSIVERLEANDIGQVRMQFQTQLPVYPYTVHRTLGSLILVDTATHTTAGAVLIA